MQRFGYKYSKQRRQDTFSISPRKKQFLFPRRNPSIKSPIMFHRSKRQFSVSFFNTLYLRTKITTREKIICH